MPSSTRPKPLVSGLALCLLFMTSCEIRQVGEPGGAESAAQPESEAPWDWTEERVFEAVNEVRAGRDLTPATWPGGARVAVALSFDVDNETIWLLTRDLQIGISDSLEELMLFALDAVRFSPIASARHANLNRRVQQDRDIWPGICMNPASQTVNRFHR